MWINQHYERNSPDQSNIIKGYYEEGKVIKRLFDMIEKKMMGKQYPEDFTEWIAGYHNWKYEQAIQAIKEYLKNFNF